MSDVNVLSGHMRCLPDFWVGPTAMNGSGLSILKYTTEASLKHLFKVLKKMVSPRICWPERARELILI